MAFVGKGAGSFLPAEKEVSFWRAQSMVERPDLSSQCTKGFRTGEGRGLSNCCRALLCFCFIAVNHPTMLEWK